MYSNDRSGHEWVPVILDIEASGFGRGSYPVEIGFALPDGSVHCTLIRPQEHWTHWSEQAARLHKITRESLFESGKPCHEVARWLNQHLRGHIVYSDAWGHDLSWLGALFEEAQAPQLFRLEALATVLSDEQMKHWSSTRQRILDKLQLDRHRASTDARVIQLTYLFSRPGSGRQIEEGV
ncbi:MAG: hypothetical protein CSB48_13980 [Proteobacteria bacterium]|nr:MAG: hypothetical protein CSB48_13980 [Pseudomonadota bacterium]